MKKGKESFQSKKRVIDTCGKWMDNIAFFSLEMSNIGFFVDVSKV